MHFFAVGRLEQPAFGECAFGKLGNMPDCNRWAVVFFPEFGQPGSLPRDNIADFAVKRAVGELFHQRFETTTETRIGDELPCEWG